MKNYNCQSQKNNALRKLCRLLLCSQGNVMVYLIVVILIFGVLGVTIVSMFTSATGSAATPNDSRRAYYVAESGIRYALSSMRNLNFNDNTIQSLNSNTYTLDDGSTFDINIFSPFFVSNSDQDTAITSTTFTLDVPNNAEIPQNFTIPSSIWAVNWYEFDDLLLDTYSVINSSSVTAEATSLTITLQDNFRADTNDIVCLAVQPYQNAPNLQEGDDIYVTTEAAQFFPSANGAIRIYTISDDNYYDYYYKNKADLTGPNRVQLTGLAALPGATWTDINLTTSDYVILSRYNYRLIAKGTSGDITVEIGNDKPLNIFGDVGVYTITMDDLVADAVPKESEPITNPLFDIDAGADKKITIGGPGSSDAFGDLWYGGDKPIGNDNNFCQSGRCLFGIGIRTFFTLEYSGLGEGFIFAFLSGGPDLTPNNTVASAGGDFERSELLGYAGDSRLDAAGTSFVDSYAERPPGLLPPKFGLEFDTYTNFDENFEQTLNYCSDATTLIPDTRNDPGPPDVEFHVVQNVFWGDTVLDGIVPDLTCRQNNMTYDDNKHDAEDIRQKWTFATGGPVRSSPAIGDDGTIYVGSNDNNVYAVNPDGTEKWRFLTGGDVISGPAVGDDGTIYVGSDDNNLYAINPDGTEEWRFLTGGDVKTTPSIGPDGIIYAGSNDNNVYAFDPDTGPPPLWSFDAGGAISLGPIGIGPTGSINFASDNARTYAIDTSGNLKWIFFTGDISEYNPGVDPNDGTVYSDIVGDSIVSIEAEDTDADGLGNEKWQLFINADFDSTPTVTEDGTIYFGTDGPPNALFALDPGNRSVPESFPTPPEWTFTTGGPVDTNPALGPDGTIFIASNDENLYALNPNVSNPADRLKFSFPLNGPVVDFERSSPAVNQDDETVYVGSEDRNLYAFNQLAVPRNFRDNSVEPKKLVTANDFGLISNNWLEEGPWAVRMEITRETVNIDGENKGRYTLKTWVEKCNGDCTAFIDGLFRDTRVEYNVAGRPPKLEQTVTISETDNEKFERFLFGFTTAAQTGDSQQAIIRDFELTFSRPGDPVVTSDPIP